MSRTPRSKDELLIVFKEWDDEMLEAHIEQLNEAVINARKKLALDEQELKLLEEILRQRPVSYSKMSIEELREHVNYLKSVVDEDPDLLPDLNEAETTLRLREQ